MESVQKKMSYKEMLEFLKRWNQYLHTNPDTIGSIFWANARNFIRKNLLLEIAKEYSKDLIILRAKYALLDKDSGTLLIDKDPKGRGFLYDRVGFQELIEAEFNLERAWDAKDMVVEPSISDEPVDLTVEQRDIFEGFII